MQIWDDVLFLKMFWFKREQPTELLKAFRLQSKSIICGRKERAQYFPSDVCVCALKICVSLQICQSHEHIWTADTHIFHSKIDLMYI